MSQPPALAAMTSESDPPAPVPAPTATSAPPSGLAGNAASQSEEVTAHKRVADGALDRPQPLKRARGDAHVELQTLSSAMLPASSASGASSASSQPPAACESPALPTREAIAAARRRMEEADAAATVAESSARAARATAVAAAHAWALLAASGPDASPAQRMHRDGLSYMLTYLPLRGLCAAAGVCAAWRAAALHLQPRGLTATLKKSAALASLFASPLRKHIGTLTLASKTWGWYFAPLPQLQQLTCLQMMEAPTYFQCAAIKQLPRLQSISFLDSDDGVPAWALDELEKLCTPPHALSNLRELDLRWSRIGRDHTLLLAKLPALTSLEPGELLQDAYPLLPRLPQLRRLALGSVEQSDESVLFDALRACPSLQVLTLKVISERQVDFSALLACVPGLTQLTLFHCTWTSLAFLQAAPALKHLRISMGVPAAALLALAQHCPHLQVLEVRSDTRLSEADAALLSPPSALLPQLTRFECKPLGYS